MGGLPFSRKFQRYEHQPLAKPKRILWDTRGWQWRITHFFAKLIHGQCVVNMTPAKHHARFILCLQRHGIYTNHTSRVAYERHSKAVTERGGGKKNFGKVKYNTRPLPTTTHYPTHGSPEQPSGARRGLLRA